MVFWFMMFDYVIGGMVIVVEEEVRSMIALSHCLACVAAGFSH